MNSYLWSAGTMPSLARPLQSILVASSLPGPLLESRDVEGETRSAEVHGCGSLAIELIEIPAHDTLVIF
jgi:hypothetical protein